MEVRPSLWINSLTNKLVQRMSRRSRTAARLNQPDLFAFGANSEMAPALAEPPPRPAAQPFESIQRPPEPAKAEPPLNERPGRVGLARQPTRVRDVEARPVHLLDVRAAAAWLGLSKSTLDKMRCYGVGPRFIRATGRAVRYDPADLAEFAQGRRQLRTTDPNPVSV